MLVLSGGLQKSVLVQAPGPTNNSTMRKRMTGANFKNWSILLIKWIGSEKWQEVYRGWEMMVVVVSARRKREKRLRAYFAAALHHSRGLRHRERVETHVSTQE